VTAVADPVRDTTTTVQASRYRPELDGLRAVAALLVIAFHAGMASAVGGYIGVDIFFVLSGFLITGLLVNSAASGPRALVTFYARRMRRLLPAALVVLLATSLAWNAVATSVERESIIGDVRSAALYFSNWHFAAQATDYFASADAPSPFVHYWSLSAEEQFYLLWPALVVIVFAAFRGNPRRGRRALGWLAVVLGAASLVSLTLATRAGSVHAYFGTDTRAYQLLAGALLALWAYGRRDAGPAHVHVQPSRVNGARLTQLLALAGLIVVASSAVDLSPTGRGLLAAGFTVALLWAFELMPRGVVGRPLSWPIPAYLGRVSYGTYLWHWPVILLLRRFATISPHFLFVVAAVISISLASMSYRMLEEPIRRSPALSARTGLVIAGGLAASLAVGLVLAPGLLSSDRRPSVTPVANGRPADVTSATSASGSTKPGSKPTLAGPALPPPKTHTPVPSAAALHDAAKAHAERTCLEKIARLGCLAHKGAGPRVLFVGDSHLETFFPVLDDLAAKHDLNLYTWMYYVCPWQKDVLPDGTNAEPCKKNKAKLYDEMLRTVRPDVVVTVNRAYDDPQYSRKVFADGHPDETDASKVLSASMPASAAAILTYAKRLIVVEPWPSLSFNPRECLSGAKYDEECRGRASRRLASERAIAAVAAHDSRVATLDLDDAVCPTLPVCDPVVGGVIVRIDNDHLTIAFAKAIEAAFDKRLIAAGAYGP
jgi:peptidoglycan/LPS O-acetylase OafA/YrhL